MNFNAPILVIVPPRTAAGSRSDPRPGLGVIYGDFGEAAGHGAPNQKWFADPTRGQAIMAHEYLADLNTEQRHAVEHGIDAECVTTAPPLLVIAGAGSGKTKTLAHRVAHLVVSGVDPHRILLLTFTRRAAEEMLRRVKGISAPALGGQQVDLPGSGTFHAVGARLLREYAPQIGLKPSFTILDRSDAADLMDLVRHDLGQSKKPSRFPKKD